MSLAVVPIAVPSRYKRNRGAQRSSDRNSTTTIGGPVGKGRGAASCSAHAAYEIKSATMGTRMNLALRSHMAASRSPIRSSRLKIRLQQVAAAVRIPQDVGVRLIITVEADLFFFIAVECFAVEEVVPGATHLVGQDPSVLLRRRLWADVDVEGM